MKVSPSSVQSNYFTSHPLTRDLSIAVALAALGALAWYRGKSASSKFFTRVGMVAVAASCIPFSSGLYRAATHRRPEKPGAREAHPTIDPTLSSDEISESTSSISSEKAPLSFDDDFDPTSYEPRHLEKAIERLSDLFPKRTKKNNWQKKHPEEKQISFRQFVSRYEGRPIPEGHKLYVLPFFTTNTAKKTRKALTRRTAKHLEALYGRPCAIMKPHTEQMLQDAYVAASKKRAGFDEKLEREHFHKAFFIEKKGDQLNMDWTIGLILARIRPQRSSSIMMVTDRDINRSREGWDFFFGAASPQGGICSVHRFLKQKERRGERRFTDVRPEIDKRFLTLTAHEAGHTLGMDHCIEDTCVINGYNNANDLDKSPPYFCPTDLAKVCYRTQTTPLGRCKALRKFYKKHGYKEAAKMMSRCIKHLQAPSSSH